MGCRHPCYTEEPEVAPSGSSRPLTFETVEVPGATRLSTVARAIKVDADDVEELNPHLVRKMTPPGRLGEVRIPAGGALRVALHRAP